MVTLTIPSLTSEVFRKLSDDDLSAQKALQSHTTKHVSLWGCGSRCSHFISQLCPAVSIPLAIPETVPTLFNQSVFHLDPVQFFQHRLRYEPQKNDRGGGMYQVKGKSKQVGTQEHEPGGMVIVHHDRSGIH